MAAIMFVKGSDFLFLISFTMLTLSNYLAEGHNYSDALAKSILFFQGQRSGKLYDQDQALGWRGDSALSDGQSDGMDLTGGYYDAGDNVKFNFPMAFTITVLSWGVIENGNKMAGQLPKAMAAIRWGTDYLLKSAQHLNTSGKLYAVVANPNLDHSCWQRAEDMDTDRTAYYVTPENPGSDLAAEMAAAMAAASMVFRKTDHKYAKQLLQTAKNVWQFAVDHRRRYSESLPIVCPFYCSYSGYTDELLWGAAWMHKATGEDKYVKMIESFSGNGPSNAFSWDDKYSGAYVLLAKRNLVNNDPTFEQYRRKAEDYMCKILPKSQYLGTYYTQGGLMYVLEGSNLQYVASAAFLLTTLSKYMSASNYTFPCGNFQVTRSYLRAHAKKQVDYILGDNPMKMSYMVGYGSKYPTRLHHRCASVLSMHDHPARFGCGEGFNMFLYTQNPDPNQLLGAVVGGPDRDDSYADDRTRYTQSEPTTYINAAIVGPLAYFAANTN